jgi:short-subunit dehydrogenase
MSPSPLAGKTAVVTGASSGIGRALAPLLAKRGFEVWVAARRRPELEKLAGEIASQGGVAHAFELDVSRPEETEAKVRELDREIGGFDLVVANAGIGLGAVPVAQEKLSDVRVLMETNLLGAVATLLPVIPGMIERGRGHLVGVSSLAAETPLPAAAAYGTSKAAFSFWLESAASDLKPRGLDVTIVHPGFVKTPLTDKNAFPMPFLVDVDDAARIIDRAILRRARMCRFPLPLASASTAGRWMPRAVRDFIVNKQKPAL